MEKTDRRFSISLLLIITVVIIIFAFVYIHNKNNNNNKENMAYLYGTYAELTYTYDFKTDLCYAYIDIRANNLPFTFVPCTDKVMKAVKDQEVEND